MLRDSQNLRNARTLAVDAARALSQSPAFQRLAPATQTAIVRDLDKVHRALDGPASVSHAPVSQDPYAFPLDTPADRFRRAQPGNLPQPGNGSQPNSTPAPAAQPAQPPDPTAGTAGRGPATETIAKRMGALSDEINFPAFVASLVHGTYDAVVDASIRQMEAFADLIGAVAKDVDQFTSENITRGQALDWLAHQYPRDLVLDVPLGPNAGEPAIHPRQVADENSDDTGPSWLSDFGVEGPLTDDLIEEQLVPAARKKLGESRLHTLATMVLLGMNRINVKDGSISAKVRFRAAATDKAEVNYAASTDPGAGNSWGERGSSTYEQHTTMVSTVGANVQTDSELKAELFGEVRINFVSETLPLDRFVDAAQLAVLQRNGKVPQQSKAAPAAPPAALPAPAQAPMQAAVPATPSATPAPPQGGK